MSQGGVQARPQVLGSLGVRPWGTWMEVGAAWPSGAGDVANIKATRGQVPCRARDLDSLTCSHNIPERGGTIVHSTSQTGTVRN